MKYIYQLINIRHCLGIFLLLSSTTLLADELLEKPVSDKPNVTWSEFLDLLNQPKPVAHYPTVQASPERLPKYLLMSVAQGYLLLSQANPDYPAFLPFINQALNFGGPNPDTTYYYVALDGKSQYRISGHRGTVKMIEFQAGVDFLGFSPTPGKNLTSATMDNFAINSDGTFEILLSTDKPDNYQGNWMKLEEQSNYMLVRQVGYDPTEINAKMAIEKIGGPTSNNNFEESDTLLPAVANYVRDVTTALLGLNVQLKRDNIYNNFVIPHWSTLGGVINQTYHHTLYKATNDEALIISVKIPEACEYWNIQSNDLLIQTNDFMRYQTSLNGYIDRADADVVTRIVLSHRDPGVKNWVDLRGLEEGYLIMRWIGCGETPNPAIEQMKLADINKHLPKDTHWITPEQRAQDLREMYLARQFRRYW